MWKYFGSKLGWEVDGPQAGAPLKEYVAGCELQVHKSAEVELFEADVSRQKVIGHTFHRLEGCEIDTSETCAAH